MHHAPVRLGLLVVRQPQPQLALPPRAVLWHVEEEAQQLGVAQLACRGRRARSGEAPALLRAAAAGSRSLRPSANTSRLYIYPSISPPLGQHISATPSASQLCAVHHHLGHRLPRGAQPLVREGKIARAERALRDQQVARDVVHLLSISAVASAPLLRQCAAPSPLAHLDGAKIVRRQEAADRVVCAELLAARHHHPVRPL